MGMYTGLRGTITFKEEFRNRLSDNFEWEDVIGNDTEVKRTWLNHGRNSFIPNGSVCYMPEDWGKNRRKYDKGELSFACSLKNYGGEIESFLELLEEIAISWDLEELYEEDDTPIIHRRN